MSKKVEDINLTNSNKTVLTQEGLKQFEEEREYLLVEIEKNKVELQEARAQGDLSENAEYDAARDNQARLDHRMKEIEAILNNYVIIESIRKDIVSLGSKVTIRDEDTKEVATYTIVGSVESDPLNGKLSNVTPLAMAILDHKVNDKVTVEKIEEPYDVTILGIE